MPLAEVSSISATVGDCAPTNCTFSSLTVVYIFAQGTGPFTRSHGLSNHQTTSNNDHNVELSTILGLHKQSPKRIYSPESPPLFNTESFTNVPKFLEISSTSMNGKERLFQETQ